MYTYLSFGEETKERVRNVDLLIISLESFQNIRDLFWKHIIS